MMIKFTSPESQNTEFKSSWHDDYLKKLGNELGNNFGMISERVRNDFGKEMAKAFEIIIKHPEWTAEQIAEELGKTSRTIENYLSRLKKAGIIKRIGPKLGGHWEVTVD